MTNFQHTNSITRRPHSLAFVRFTHVFLFFVGASAYFSFTAIGKVFLPDIILTLALPYAIFNKPNKTPWLLAAPIFILLIFWLLGAALTDVIRESPFRNYSRGLAKIALFGIALVSLLGLTQAKIDRLMAYFGGLAAAGIMTTLIIPNEYQRGEPWKFGYSVPIAILTVILASLPLQRRLLGFFKSAGLPAAMAIVNLALNYRSNYLILAAGVAVELSGGGVSRPMTLRKRNHAAVKTRPAMMR